MENITPHAGNEAPAGSSMMATGKLTLVSDQVSARASASSFGVGYGKTCGGVEETASFANRGPFQRRLPEHQLPRTSPEVAVTKVAVYVDEEEEEADSGNGEMVSSIPAQETSAAEGGAPVEETAEEEPMPSALDLSSPPAAVGGLSTPEGGETSPAPVETLSLATASAAEKAATALTLEEAVSVPAPEIAAPAAVVEEAAAAPAAAQEEETQAHVSSPVAVAPAPQEGTRATPTRPSLSDPSGSAAHKPQRALDVPVVMRGRRASSAGDARRRRERSGSGRLLVPTASTAAKARSVSRDRGPRQGSDGEGQGARWRGGGRDERAPSRSRSRERGASVERRGGGHLRLTVPKSPKLATGGRSFPPGQSSQLSTEEQELQRMAGMQEHFKRMRERNVVAANRNAVRSKLVSVRSIKPLTMPYSPKLSTGGRFGEKHYAAVGSHAETAPSAAFLADTHPLVDHEPPSNCSSSNTSVGPPKPTIPAPFKLSSSGKERHTEHSDGVHADTLFAEAMKEQEKTPPRFHSVASGTKRKASEDHQQAHTGTRKLTVPVQPKLRTDSRVGTKEKPLSSEERELLAIQEVQIQASKAKAAGPCPSRRQEEGVDRAGAWGVSRPSHPVKALTRPVGPKLHDSHRPRAETSAAAAEAEQQQQQQRQQQQFKARPVPSHLFDARKPSTAPSQPRELTQPRSPQLTTSATASALATGARLTSEDRELLEMKQCQFKALPMPTMESSSGPPSGAARRGSSGNKWYSQRELTLPKSPAFASKGRDGGVAKPVPPSSEELELREMAAYRFTAAPLPDYEDMARSGRRAPVSTSLTQARPFSLCTEERGRHKAAELLTRVEQERQEEAAAHTIKVRPVPHSLREKTLLPVPARRPPTVFEPLNLNGPARHEEAQRRMLDRQEEERQGEREAGEFRARQLPKSAKQAGFAVHKSRKPLTDPLGAELPSAIRMKERQAWEEEKQRRDEEEQRRSEAREEARRVAEEEDTARLRRLPVSEGGFAFKAREVEWDKEGNRELGLGHVDVAPLTEPVSPMLSCKARAEARGEASARGSKGGAHG